MPESFQTASPSPEELRDLTGTLSSHPDRRDVIASRLQFIADLLADAGPLPPEPLLLWREPDQTIRKQTIGTELVVGRSPGSGLVLADDKALSRRHFVVRQSGDAFRVQDVDSHNGTAVNEAKARIREHALRDGDLILAGNHVFAFLDQRQTI